MDTISHSFNLSILGSFMEVKLRTFWFWARIDLYHFRQIPQFYTCVVNYAGQTLVPESWVTNVDIDIYNDIMGSGAQQIMASGLGTSTAIRGNKK